MTSCFLTGLFFKSFSFLSCYNDFCEKPQNIFSLPEDVLAIMCIDLKLKNIFTKKEEEVKTHCSLCYWEVR